MEDGKELEAEVIAEVQERLRQIDREKRKAIIREKILRQIGLLQDEEPSELVESNTKEDSIPVIETAPYEAHPDDPEALQRSCPICPAMVGVWCGGFGDVHWERHSPEAQIRIKAEEDRIRKEIDELEGKLDFKQIL